MRLNDVLRFGGLGSGCNPDAGKCGRPAGSGHGKVVTLYHGTAAKFITSIRKKGLQPGNKSGISRTSGNNRVFTTSDKMVALRYAALANSELRTRGTEVALVVLNPSASSVVTDVGKELGLKAGLYLGTALDTGIGSEHISHVEFYKTKDLPKTLFEKVYKESRKVSNVKPSRVVRVHATSEKQLFVAVVITGKAK